MWLLLCPRLANILLLALTCAAFHETCRLLFTGQWLTMASMSRWTQALCAQTVAQSRAGMRLLVLRR